MIIKPGKSGAGRVTDTTEDQKKYYLAKETKNEILRLIEQSGGEYFPDSINNYATVRANACEWLKELIAENERLQTTIEVATYELEQLERVLDMPSRGYVRNGYNGVLRTLRDGF